MKKSITARHNANRQVLLTLKSNESKFSGVPVMAAVISKLEELVNETSSLLTKVEGIPARTAGNKDIARADLVAIALKVSNVVKVYAFIARNENLSSFLVTAESDLSRNMRQQELLDYTKNLLAHIAPIALELAEYGLTDAMATELDTEINDYEALITEPRQLISERKTTNELIEDRMDEIYTLLINQTDPLMELFIDDQELYLSYKSARMIVDPATHANS